MSAQGKTVAALLGLVAPAVAIGVTIAWFASNPVSIVIELTVLIGGGFYLVTYQDHE